MKKRMTIIIAIVAALLLAVSCSMDNKMRESESDVLAYVTFGSAGARDLSASYNVAAYESLYWYYTAEKADGDGYGSSGETNGPTPISQTGGTGLSGTVGPFSQGTWNFILYAYEDDSTDSTLVYSNVGTPTTVVLKGGTNTVPVSVTPQGKTGTITFNDAYFAWKNGGGTSSIDVVVSIVGAEDGHSYSKTYDDVTSSNGKYTLSGNLSFDTIDEAVPADLYKCNIAAYIPVEGNDYTDVDPLAANTFVFRVYGSATTVISGDLIEDPNAYVTFDAFVEIDLSGSTDAGLAVFQEPTTVTISTSPAAVNTGAEEAKSVTTVDLSNAKTLVSGATHNLDMQITTGTTAEESFQISGQTGDTGEFAVASLDLTLTAVNADGTTQEISKFSEDGTTAVTITTYIATGLQNVAVRYVDDDGKIVEDSGVHVDSYDSETGELVFTTTHFSTFVVTSKNTDNTDFAYGYGTKEYPYVIKSEEQFANIDKLSSEMKGGKYYYFSIESDLDFSKENFKYDPSIAFFRGELDFNNNKLAGISREHIKQGFCLIYDMADGAIRNMNYLPDGGVNLVYLVSHTSTNCEVVIENITAGYEGINKTLQVENNEGLFICHAYGPNNSVTLRNLTNYYDIEEILNKNTGIFMSGYPYNVETVTFENCDNYGTIRGNNLSYLTGNSTYVGTASKIIYSGCDNLGALIATGSVGFVTYGTISNADEIFVDKGNNTEGTLTKLVTPTTTAKVESQTNVITLSETSTGYASYEIIGSAYAGLYLKDTDTKSGTQIVTISTGRKTLAEINDLEFKKLNFIDSNFALVG